MLPSDPFWHLQVIGIHRRTGTLRWIERSRFRSHRQSRVMMSKFPGSTPAPGVGFRALAKTPCGWRRSIRIRGSSKRCGRSTTSPVFGEGTKDNARGGRAPLCVPPQSAGPEAGAPQLPSARTTGRESWGRLSSLPVRATFQSPVSRLRTGKSGEPADRNVCPTWFAALCITVSPGPSRFRIRG